MTTRTSTSPEGMRKRFLVHQGHADPVEHQAWEESVRVAYLQTQNQPAVMRRVRVLEEFAVRAVIKVADDDRIVGSKRFLRYGGPKSPGMDKILSDLGWRFDMGHIIHDYGGLLAEGLPGRWERIRRHPQADGTAMIAMARAMQAFRRFIERHIEVCSENPALCELTETLSALLVGPPTTLGQALHLLWLAHLFLHAENPLPAISFGRMDHILWPYAQADLAAGRLDQEGVRDLIAAFCLRCCEVGDSQNLTLGGVDADGHDTTNPLSSIFLEVVGSWRLLQPSLTVRWHPGADPRFLTTASTLAAQGLGQPAFINDMAVIPALQELGIPLARARDYGIVGCYEACPQGDCYVNTVGLSMSLTDLLARYLADSTASDASSLRADFLATVTGEYRRLLVEKAQKDWDARRDLAPSPLGSALLAGCIENASDMAEGGARFNLYGINIHGLADTVDGLQAIEEIVFRRRELTLAEMVSAMAQDFPDENLRRRLASIGGRYGTDHPASNGLAAWLSEAVARMVLDSRMDGGVRPYPGLFGWMYEVHNHRHAGPDGRRKADDLAYGVGPSPRTLSVPTAVLNSAAHVAHHLCACGNPLGLHLQKADLANETGIARLSALITTYFHADGFHLHINTVDADHLRRAQQNPQAHGELLIRISGLSARFVTLGKDLQDVLIRRADSQAK